MKAWHFLADTGLLRDGSVPPLDGEWLKYDGKLSLCRNGLHASVRALDALLFAPGNVVCLVEIGGEMVQEDDKLVCSARKILARANAEEVLRDFARKCALNVADKWSMPVVVRQWLETGDKSIRKAAERAARDAANSAAGGAAYSAAWSAANSAARSAAYNAAYSAAWSAAYSAVRSVAWSAAGGAAWSAAYSAAYSAARSAAWSAQNEILETMFLGLLGVM
jgi:hypothetical protein